MMIYIRKMNLPLNILAITLSATLLLAQGCATKPDKSDKIAFATYQEINDPIEPLNRYFFELTRFADFLFLRPFSEIYKNIVPKMPRVLIKNFSANLSEPSNLINNILQGEARRSGITLGRLLINTTVGIGGFLDAADYFLEWEEQNEDFGQTLAVYGMPEGPFLFIPLGGPSTFRDAVGITGGIFINPISYVDLDSIEILLNIRIPVNVLEASVSSRQFIEQIERESIDYYATVRELYRQNRRSAILNGELDFDALPEIPDDDFMEEDP